MHPRAQGWRDVGGGFVRGGDDGAHCGVKLLAGIGVDPGLIRIGRSGAGVDVAPHLRIDPKAGQQRPEQHFVWVRIGGGEQIRNVMVTRRRERGLRKRARRDAVLLEKRAVQRPLDDQRPLRCFGELHDPIRIRRLRGRERQSSSKADEVVRVLRDVMLEARLAQRAGRELRMVEGVPGTKRRTPRRTETWWAREACPRITIPMTYFVQPTQMLALRPKDNSRNCPACAAHTRWSRRATRSASGWPATSLRPSTISTATTLRRSSNAPLRLGSYSRGNATRRATEKRCGPDGDTRTAS